MATKDRNAATKRKIKLHNNSTSRLPLRCQVPHCEENFYVRHVVNKKWQRNCLFHYENPPQEAQASNKNPTGNLLAALKLI